MPFSLTDPELTPDALQAITMHVERTYSPEDQSRFFGLSGKTPEEWAQLGSSSHEDYRKLSQAFYAFTGSSDPEQMYPVGAVIEHMGWNPATLSAKVLASPGAVMKTVATLTRFFSKDSWMRVTNQRPDGATIVHTTLGYVPWMYAEQVTHGIGYFHSLKGMLDLDEFDHELFMMQMPLPYLLANFPEIFNSAWGFDERKNIVDASGDLIARLLPFPDTGFARQGLYPFEQEISLVCKDTELEGSVLEENENLSA